MFCELKVAAPGPQPSRLAREAVPGADKRSRDAGGSVDLLTVRGSCNSKFSPSGFVALVGRVRRSERRRKDEYAARNAPGSCRHSDAATIAETGRDFGMRGGTCSSDAVDHRLEHCTRGAEGNAVYGRSSSRYGRTAAQVRTAALVRRDAVERHACYRAGIFRPVEDLRVVAADGRGHAHRRRRR